MTEEFDVLFRLQRNANGSGPALHLSPDTRSHLLRWYSGNPFDTNEATVKKALRVLEWCEENSGIFEFSSEMRRTKLESGAETLGISVSSLSELMAREHICYQPRTCRLIAFEGVDEACTVRQMDLLHAYLVQRKVHALSLGRTGEGEFFGREIGRLQNQAAEAQQSAVDPKSMALWDALNRRERVLDTLKHAAAETVVLLDRYTLSNAVYASVGSNENLADWVFEMEHTHLGIPAPDIYFVLNMPLFLEHKVEQSVGSSLRHAQECTSALVGQRYRELALRFPQIEIVECVADSGAGKSPEAINIEILAHLRSRKFLA